MALDRDFGPYELKEELGKGGMAKVYLAVQKALQRPVALKVLFSHLAEDEKIVQRFVREAKTASELHHENIVQVIDCGRHDNMAFICMEFVEGLDLQKWLKAHGAPPLEIALLMMRDLCRGIEHAHSKRVTHRDIKPANVMLTPEGAIKIMDFGLARADGEVSEALTMIGAVLGTPAYMSPEQATGERVDERSDIFSAGVVAYELLGGRRPFDGDSYAKVLSAVLTADPTDITRVNPLVPEEVAVIVRGMLQKDAGKRTGTISQVRQELEAVIHDMGLLRPRELMRDYTLDPQATAVRWHTKRLTRHLDQGRYFEAMGQARIDDALLEYRRVLHLDPDNAAAREHVQKLERERERGASAAAAVATTAKGATKKSAPGTGAAAAAAAATAASAKGGLPRGVLIAAIALPVIAVLAFFVMRGSNNPGGTAGADADSLAAAVTDSAAAAAAATVAPAATAVLVAPADTAAAPATVCSLYVLVSPRADRVLVNGKPATGKDSTFAFAYPGGRYKLEASATGYSNGHSSGRGKIGDVLHVALTLAVAPAAVPATPPTPVPNAAPPVAAAPADPANGISQVISVIQKCDIYVAHVLRAQGSNQVEIKLAPGKYEVVFRHPDFVDTHRDIQIKAGKPTKPLKVDLTMGEGGISVRAAKAGLRIFLDDKSSGQTTPGVVRGIKPGRHKVELRESNGVTVVATQSVVVADSPGNQVVQF